MIDTIVLILSPAMYSITNPDKFEPTARWATVAHTKRPRGMQSRQNPTRKELALGIYKPRLTLTDRITPQGRTTTLKVELSLPKLMFGNNFAELQYKDFKHITATLTDTLSGMGIQTTPETLAQAPVSSVHYSKNILLTDGSTPYHYINKIKEANVGLPLDVNQTDYRNEGHSYKWHCNTYEMVFYDKIKDLATARTSDKRCIEKDNAVQLHVYDTLQQRHNYELLRMEVRLNKRAKMKQLFKTLDIKSDLTFKKLFKPAISKKVLLHYLDELERKRPPLLDYRTTNDKALLIELVMGNPDLGPRQILHMYGLKRALDALNPRELRTLFAGHPARSWYRLIADAAKIRLASMQSPFKVIREQLEKFRAVK